jgi:hypothetical protein
MQASATLAGKASRRFLRIARGVVDGVLPPRCLACGEMVDEPDALCGRCWAGITFFAPPWCVGCGLPFPHPMGEDALCGACARERRSWDRARAVFRYDKNSRRLVLGLKHGDRTHLAGAFGRWMHRAGKEILAGADLLVRCRCTGRGSFSAATTKRRCLRRRSVLPAGLMLRPIGWFVAAAPRRKATSDPLRASATCAAPLRYERVAVSRASGW